MKRTALGLVLLALGAILCSCVSQESSEFQNTMCISPLEDFAYYPKGGEKPGPTPMAQLPVGDWEAIATIPNLTVKEISGHNTAELVGIQTLDTDDRVWVIFEGDEEYHLSYYQIEGEYWVDIELDQNYGDWLLFPQIYIGSDNQVWMTSSLSEYDATGVSGDTVVLSVYDETENQFETVLTLEDIHLIDVNSRIAEVSISNLQVDQQGNLWFFFAANELGQERKYQLIQYLPSRHSLEKHLDEVNNFSSLSFVTSQDNILYLLDEDNANVLRYDWISKEVKMIEIPDGVRDNDFLISSSSLFLDSQQRLWINDNGWLDLFPGGDWHVIIHSPIFIDYQYYGNGLWWRTRPSYSIDTEDGRLWYSSSRGTGWVNPDTGKWCLFSSYASNVVKDSKGDLWMIAEEKLYRKIMRP